MEVYGGRLTVALNDWRHLVQISAFNDWRPHIQISALNTTLEFFRKRISRPSNEERRTTRATVNVFVRTSSKIDVWRQYASILSYVLIFDVVVFTADSFTMSRTLDFQRNSRTIDFERNSQSFKKFRTDRSGKCLSPLAHARSSRDRLPWSTWTTTTSVAPAYVSSQRLLVRKYLKDETVHEFTCGMNVRARALKNILPCRI